MANRFYDFTYTEVLCVGLGMDPMEAALLAHRILTDQTLRRELVTAQRQRQLLFSYQEIRKIFEPQMHAIFQPHTKEEAVQP